jgi:hypothetical protein
MFLTGCKPYAQREIWDIRDVSWSMVTNSGASDGVYLKANWRIDDRDFYFKLSNYDSYRGVFGHESVNELIASRLGKLLGFNVPDGHLIKAYVKIEGAEYEAYVYAAQSYKHNRSRSPFEDFYRSFRLSLSESPLEFCTRLGWAKEIYMMFVFDYLIINRDRHGANLEVLKNENNKLSPLFDNGLSFVCTHTETIGVNDFDVMLDRPVNNFIGERSLERNLSLIDAKLPFNELKSLHRQSLFINLEGVLDKIYFDKIWDILEKRWENVKKFCIA